MNTGFREVKSINQEEYTYTRRWFTCDTSNLFVWQDANNNIAKFQLTCASVENENIFIWNLNKGIEYSGISNNCNKVGIKKGSPILEEYNDCKFTDFEMALLNNARTLNSSIMNFVLEKLARPERL